ncbi:hypothetical protein OWM07_10645 [Deferribacter thermophilus]|uniref:hypothetical protein n=1 Tax=Deferribacter thermophilus TaxID=53573 RepID=UPI003C26CBF8
MRKIFPCLVIIFLLGCSYHSTTVKNFSKAIRTPLDNGYLYLAALIEAKTNFSSLLYDKTKVKIVEDSAYSSRIISKNKKIYIMPLKKQLGDKITYDETIQTAIKNYITMNKFSLITNNLNEADYIAFTFVKGSLTKNVGENFSEINLTIFDKKENVVFYSKVKGVSKSDENFWYYPTKSAKPTSYITLKTLEFLFKKQLPKAFERGA